MLVVKMRKLVCSAHGMTNSVLLMILLKYLCSIHIHCNTYSITLHEFLDYKLNYSLLKFKHICWPNRSLA